MSADKPQTFDSEPPPRVGLVLGAAGGPVEFGACGRRYKMGHPTQKAKDRLEKLAVARALDKVRKLKDTLPRDAYQEVFTEATAQITTGYYETWREGWATLMLAKDGSSVPLFVRSLLLEHHPDITEEEVGNIIKDAGEEVVAALAQMLPSFFLHLLTYLNDEARAALEPVVTEQMAALREKLRTLSRPATAGSAPPS